MFDKGMVIVAGKEAFYYPSFLEGVPKDVQENYASAIMQSIHQISINLYTAYILKLHPPTRKMHKTEYCMELVAKGIPIMNAHIVAERT